MAVGTGVDVSAEAGDIVLMRDGMEAVLTALALSRATMRNIRQNLFWAFGYNVLGLPVAAGLLHAFAQVKTPGARLRILGEGPLRAELTVMRDQLGLAGRVELPGFTSDIAGELGAARCFALSSRTESFGLACVEALSFGLPCVVTDCGGPQEIIDKPALGAVVPVGDRAALALAIDAALSDAGDPAPRQSRAHDFALDVALDHYDALITHVMSQARSPV